MSQKAFRGLQKHQEARPDSSIRDVRPLKSRVYDFILDRRYAPALMLAFAFCMYVFPLVNDFLFLLMLSLFLYIILQRPVLPFKLPIGSKFKDSNAPMPASGKPGKAQGIYYFGNDVNLKHELWFANDDMRTHALIFGSTGSGKTEALISLSYNALVRGSGLIYVDGKGDNALYAKIFSVARSLGREDDLLVINYMTGGQDIIGKQKEATSNTLNPFAAGSSSMLSQLIVSLMGSSSSGGGDGDMWKGRAISFVEALMRVLVYLRDEGYFQLDASLIRKYFVLDVIEDLLEKQQVVDQYNNIITLREKLPFSVTDPIYNYLATLPGYQKKNVGKQSDKTYEQHGYITMQLTRIFGSLADVYAYIMRTNLAEVDFEDVILNRRILVVLLPALEKSPDELSNLGKLIIASLKTMLASGLGNKLQGDYKDVIEAKPSNSNEPFLCVLDEYGYYAVEGFAVVPAQARSLGFSVIFAGQDLPAFQKASKEEAASIFANTNVKICMKLEDPTETWDFFSKTAGEAYVTVARSYNMGNDGSALSYRDSKEAGVEKRSRIDLMDLKEQAPGEAHVFFKSGITRARMFYANPPKTKQLRVNAFIKSSPILIDQVDILSKVYNTDNLTTLSGKPYEMELSPLLNLLIQESKHRGLENLTSIYLQQLTNVDNNEDFISEIMQELRTQLPEYQNSFLFLSTDLIQDDEFSKMFGGIHQSDVVDEPSLIEVFYRIGIELGWTKQQIRKAIFGLYSNLLDIAKVKFQTNNNIAMLKSEIETFNQQYAQLKDRQFP
ncbi:type IV secretory system conjugative DNA transfer family protein [Facilibium subflavum]|uniref:type IV secretory system conjugative DNA transfer family protein n=1 Tax=Facilibium subflavum TaxID=2219058 RepID=UPI002E274F74